MALPPSEASALLDALRAGDGVDLGGDLMLQVLVDAETTALGGAHRDGRSDQRHGERNGYRAKTVATKAGDIEVKIPKQ